jgi:hypothetical protein
MLVALLATTGNSYASTTMVLPPLNPATGYSCSSTYAYIGSLPLPPSPALRGLPIPIGIGDNLSSPGNLLGASCADLPSGSSASGVAATASTTFDDAAGQLGMSNAVAQTDSAVPLVFRESAHTQGAQERHGNIVPPFTSQTETLSATYTYEVLAESHDNGDLADLVTGVGPQGGPAPGNTSSCENANFPHVTITGDDQSRAVGAHTVTVQYTCPAGHPLQAVSVVFGLSESQQLSVAQSTGIPGTASSHIAAIWDGGTLTIGP